MERDALDIRFGHDLGQVQDENGVDLLQLRANLELTVEQRLLGLENYLRFVEALHPFSDRR